MKTTHPHFRVALSLLVLAGSLGSWSLATATEDFAAEDFATAVLDAEPSAAESLAIPSLEEVEVLLAEELETPPAGQPACLPPCAPPARCQSVPMCCPERTTWKEEKSGWKVACEAVCVPGFRFPWEKCCGPVCGWVRHVNVLEEEKYECDTCGYEWKVKYVASKDDGQRRPCHCPRCRHGKQ